MQALDEVIAKPLAAKRAALGNLDGGWVHLNVVYADLIVQVWAGRHSGHTALCNHLALANMATDVETGRKSRQVAIGGGIAVAVVDQHKVAVAVLHAHEGDRACSRRHDRRADGNTEVDSLMHARVAEDRMKTHTKTARDASAV